MTCRGGRVHRCTGVGMVSRRARRCMTRVNVGGGDNCVVDGES